MYLHLDKAKQHARSKMHRIALLAEADTTTQIGQALSDTYSAELKVAIDPFHVRVEEFNYLRLHDVSIRSTARWRRLYSVQRGLA